MTICINVTVMLGLTFALVTNLQAASTKPNISYVRFDDLGWEQPQSYYGGKEKRRKRNRTEAALLSPSRRAREMALGAHASID